MKADDDESIAAPWRRGMLMLRLELDWRCCIHQETHLTCRLQRRGTQSILHPQLAPLIHRTRHNEVQAPLCVMAVLVGFGQYVASKRERAEAVLPVHMRDYLRKKPAGQWKSLHVAHESHMWTT